MPVSLNEPLSALQRLSEEVQYSELLDQAALLDHPCDRMVGVYDHPYTCPYTIEPLNIGHMHIQTSE